MNKEKKEALKKAAELFEIRKNAERQGLLTEYYNYTEKELAELDQSTYANLLNKTENYPWQKFLSGDDYETKNDPKSYYNKNMRINNAAREQFIKNFMAEYPEGTLVKTNKGDAEFAGIKYLANYSSYELFFKLAQKETAWPDRFSVVKDASSESGLYIRPNDIVFEPESNELVKQMLSHSK